MKKFQFSLTSLFRIQKQKLRLAEIALKSAKSNLSIAQLEHEEFSKHVDEITRDSEPMLNTNPDVKQVHSRFIKQEQRLLDEFQARIQQREKEWRVLAAKQAEEQIKLESFETLVQQELAEYEKDLEKQELTELSDGILRSLHTKEGEHFHD